MKKGGYKEADAGFVDPIASERNFSLFTPCNYFVNGFRFGARSLCLFNGSVKKETIVESEMHI